MKKISLILAVLLVLSTVAFASDGVTEIITKNFTDIKEGQDVVVVFAYEVLEKDMDLDGFKFKERLGNEYYFTALRDMDTANITLFYSTNTQEEETEDKGETEDVTETPSTGEDMGEWGAYKYGVKYKLSSESGYRYYVYLDFEDYGNPDKLIYKDIPSMNNPLDTELPIRIDYLEKTNSGRVISHYEPVDIVPTFTGEGNIFLLEIATKGYDGVYLEYHTKTQSTDVTNEFSVITRKTIDEIIAGGSGTGTTEPKEDIPLTPLEPPTEKPAETPEEETPTIEEDSPKEDYPILPIIPEEDNKEEEPELEEQEKETNEEEVIEIPEIEEEIIEKETEAPTEDIAEKTEKTDTPESIVSDDKEDRQPITLPKTGESKQLFYMIGSLMIIAGIILIKRYR